MNNFIKKPLKNPNQKDKKYTSKKKNVIKRSYIVTTIVAVVFIATFIFGFNFVYQVVKATDQFDISKLASPEVSKIYANGNVIWKLGSDEVGDRENVTYDNLPQVLVDAIVAAEDSRYFEHNGFDLPRILKAFIGNATGATYSGASTITQQIIKKSYYPEEQSTYQRKIGEVYLAIQADDEISKETILENYLNKIYYGNGTKSIGIQSASNYYFKKDVTELTLPEAALLAGTLNSPALYDPYSSIELATNRRNIILDLMVIHGYITSEECALAKKIKVEDMLYSGDETTNSNYYPYLAYIDVVIEEVKAKHGIDPTEVSVDIYTYLDIDLQTYLDSIAKGEVFSLPSDTDVEFATSVQESTTGRIIGIIGGRDYVASKSKVMSYNRASSGKASPGSSMKPITAYSAAYEFLSWSTAHTVDDSYYDTGGVVINNWDKQNHDNVQVVEALMKSWNIAAIRAFEDVNNEIGSEAYKRYLTGFGLTIGKNSDGGEDFTSNYAIGGMAEGWTPIQLSGAYATIANDGIYIEPHTIDYIFIHSDERTIKVDEELQSEKSRACSEETAFLVRESMLEYTKTGYGYYSYITVSGVDIAGKTGTSTYSNNTNKGGWMAAYSPDYAVATWVGYDSGTKILSNNDKLVAHRTTGNILRYLHSDHTSQNTFSSAPSTIQKATIIKGINDPYILADDTVPAENKIAGWFRKSNLPISLTADSLSISTLTSFNASASDYDSKISVVFAEYPDTELTTGFDETKPVTLKTLYGRIVYKTTIKDTSGNVLYATTSENPSYTIDYKFTTNITVCGQYKFAKSEAVYSNEVCAPPISSSTVVLPEVTASATINGTNVSNGIFALDTDGNGNSGIINLNISVIPSYTNNIITILLKHNTDSIKNQETSGKRANFTITAAGDYTITIIEQDSTATATKNKSINFTVVNTLGPINP